MALVLLWKSTPTALWKSTTNHRDREACAAFLSCESGNHSVCCHHRFTGPFPGVDTSPRVANWSCFSAQLKPKSFQSKCGWITFGPHVPVHSWVDQHSAAVSLILSGYLGYLMGSLYQMLYFKITQWVPQNQIWLGIWWIALWHKTGRDWCETQFLTKADGRRSWRQMENHFLTVYPFSKAEEKIFVWSSNIHFTEHEFGFLLNKDLEFIVF